MIMELNQQDFAQLQHLLPPSFASVVALCGVQVACELVRRYRGTVFKIGKNQRKAGKVLHFALAEAVGEDAATRIEIALNGQRELYIPKCSEALRELRNRQIRREYDELTTQTPYPMLGTRAENNLAYAYNLSMRQIRTILSESDRVPCNESAQMALFV